MEPPFQEGQMIRSRMIRASAGTIFTSSTTFCTITKKKGRKNPILFKLHKNLRTTRKVFKEARVKIYLTYKGLIVQNGFSSKNHTVSKICPVERKTSHQFRIMFQKQRFIYTKKIKSICYQ